MITTFKAALAICGLSQSEAADFLEVSIDTVKAWCAGRANPPLGVWQMLASLYDQMQEAAFGAAEEISLEGVDPRAYGRLDVAVSADNLPSGSMKTAGAMALLTALVDDE